MRRTEPPSDASPERDGDEERKFGRISRRGVIAAASVVAIEGAVAQQPGRPPSAADSSSSTLVLPALGQLATRTVPSSVSAVFCQGHWSAGDGGQARWRRVQKAPSHGGFVRDASGAMFELTDAIVRPEMFGARGGDHDDGHAIRRAVAMGVASGRRVEFPAPRYSLSGEIGLPGNIGGFALVGGALTELVQLDDDTSIFHFTAGNTHNWTIEGFRFAWRRDQTPAHTRSYAIRFDGDPSPEGAAGHWNIVIANCLIGNGFRGFGQSEDGQARPKCPVWGATFRNIRASITLSGAAIALRTWGRSGQPNNRIEHFYARCERKSEPAIILEAMETAVLTSLEFNRGAGCQIQVESSSNVLLQAVRFEEVGLGPSDCLVAGYGGLTQLRVEGLAVQSVPLVTQRPRRGSTQRSILRLARGARGTLRGFSDIPWRSEVAARLAKPADRVAIVECEDAGTCAVEEVGVLSDPALILARSERAAGIGLTGCDRYDFALAEDAAPSPLSRIVRAKGRLAMVTVAAPGGSDLDIGILRNGTDWFRAKINAERPGIPEDSLQRTVTQWQVRPGEVLTVERSAIASPALLSIWILPS